MANLAPDSTDRLVTVAKGVAGACPIIGPAVAEVIGTVIPNQRLDRVVAFLKELEAETKSQEGRLKQLERNLASEQGLDILEEGLLQASRSVTATRKERLAHLVSRALSAEELKYEEARKLLNLLRELTDPEIIWLLFYSKNPTLGKGPHSELVQLHPDILKPVSRELGSPQATIDRGALQDSYKNTLLRMDLLQRDGPNLKISSLGRLMVRYIEDDTK